jgi:ABC-type phosphonate transport system ATPase subunit
MPRVRNMPAAQRMQLARELIKQAREVEVPEGIGKNDFSYIAKVKDLLRQAHDLVQFIPKTPSATREMKAEVQKIFEEIERSDREILSPESGLPAGSR